MLFVAVIETLKISRNVGLFFVSLLADLSKSFDLMWPDRIITKLEVYGFHKKTLKLF